MVLGRQFGNRYLKVIFTILLCIFIFGHLSWAQNRDTCLNVNFKNIPFGKIIESIESQTDYRFFYSEDLIANIPLFTYRSSSVTVQKLLKDLLKKTALTFSIDGNLIVIKPGLNEKISASNNSIHYLKISGVVHDKEGETLPGVNVFLKHLPNIGVTTDINGVYSIYAHLNDTLCFSYVGFHKREMVIRDTLHIQNVLLKESSEFLDEVMIVGYGKQRSVSVVGSISTMNMGSVNLPVTPVSNMLAGRLTGMIGVQYSGEPGSDFSEFWIRGISTFGANRKAMVLIDGIERNNLDDLVLTDIEHFSILKDATATAIYGARGGNGVVLVNTKRGKQGKLRVNLNTRLSLETLPRLPHYLDALDYASLANEAHVVRGEQPEYTERDLQVIRHHLDPDLFPDVDWQEELLKNNSFSSLSSLSIIGGSRIVNYYLSGYFRTNSSIYKGNWDNRNKMNRTLSGFRSNFDIQPHESLKVAFDLSTTYAQINKPGGSVNEDLWQTLTEITPLLAPKQYSNGYFSSYGSDNKMVPTTLLNKTGYQRGNVVAFYSRLTIVKDFHRILKGLSLETTLSFDNQHVSKEQYIKSPALYRAVDRDKYDGTPIYLKTKEAIPGTYSSFNENQKSVYLEGKINYSAFWNSSHRLDVMLLYNQRNMVGSDTNVYEAVPYRNQGLAGRISYSLDDIYLTEVNFGYTGTENFPRHERFGFFPSIALGWVVSNYRFFREKWPSLTLLKIRYSIGLVGNDKILNKRFPDITYVDFNAKGYEFGSLGENVQTGITEEEIGSGRIQWEVARKRNLGIDLNIRNRILINFDWYQDHRKGIFMRRESLPDIMGVNPQPYGNWGEMRNWGFDGAIVIPVKWKDWLFEMSGTFTYTQDKIEKYEESVPDFPYQKRGGNWNMISRGLVALGLFRNEEDVRNSPEQFGRVLPGDVKYKDVNGDGVITDDDIVPIGYGNVPKLQYGITLNVSWKNFYASVFFRGAGKVNFFYGGSGFFPFAHGAIGNILSVVDQPGKRWIPASYSGTAATENPGAIFPRLTYGYNANNNRPSTFWLVNGSYFRFKNIEIGYHLPRFILEKVYLSSCSISFIGDNLAVWSKVKYWDPEQVSSNGAVYPIPRSYTLSLSIGF